MIRILFFIFLPLFSAASQSSLLKKLTFSYPQTAQALPAYQNQIKTVSQVFFNRLPESSLPANLSARVTEYYQPLVSILPAEDQEIVMNHLMKFYSLLHMTVQIEKAFERNAKNPQTTPDAPSLAQLYNPVPPQQSSNGASLPIKISIDDIAQSSLWQDYLKMTITECYAQEHFFLKELAHSSEKIFKYLPHFEVMYYNENFVALRNDAESVRLYLLLSEGIRNYLCSQSTEWGPLYNNFQTVTKTEESISQAFFSQGMNLLSEIRAFQTTDFYKNMAFFKSRDITQRVPVIFTADSSNTTVISFESALSGDYDFSEYFHMVNGKPIIASGWELFFDIIKDSSGSYNCYFTGLGAAIFTEATQPDGSGFPNGKILYTTLPLGNGRVKLKASFAPSTFYKNLFNGTPPSPTFGFFCAITLSCIRYLQNDLAALFNDENLDTSLAIIGNNQQKYPHFPSCIKYTPASGLVLNKINDLYTQLKQTSQQDSQQQITPAHHASSAIGHFFTHTVADQFDDVGDGFKDLYNHHGLKGAFEKLLDPLQQAVDTVKDEALVAYYSTAIFPMAFQGESVTEAEHHAADYQAAADRSMTRLMKDTEGLVNDLGKAAASVGDLAGSILGGLVGYVDPTLGRDITGTIDALVNSTVSVLESGANMLIQTVAETYILTADAVTLLTTVICTVVVSATTGAPVNWHQLKGVLEQEGMQFVEDTVTAILGTVSLAIQSMAAQLSDLTLGFSYIVSFITEALIVITAALAMVAFAIADGITGGAFDLNPLDAFNDVYDGMEKYSLIINAVVGIALLITITVLTGGLAAPEVAPMGLLMLANLGFMAASSIMGLVGSVQDNIIALRKQRLQDELVTAYETYVENNYNTSRLLLARRSLESLLQYQGLKDNSERSLLFEQNVINSQINTTVSSSSFTVDQYVFGLTQYDPTIYSSATPSLSNYPYDTTVSVEADPGQLYGFVTNRLNIAPSNGFLIYNQGRDRFSQEGLVDPIIVPAQASNPVNLSSDKPLETFWYQQKDIFFLPNPSNIETDIIWRVTTQRETPFRIGIYLSERAIDLTALQNFYINYNNFFNSSSTSYDQIKSIWDPFDAYNKYIFNFDNQAKIFVLQRDPVIGQTIEVNNKATLGVYTVNSVKYQNNWAPTKFQDINFQRGTWYRMKASLENDSMNVSFWEIGDDAAYEVCIQNPSKTNAPLAQASIPVEKAAYSEKIISVVPTLKNFAGTIGFVMSGAAVEYKILSPAPSIVSTPLRTQEYNSLISSVYQNTKPLEQDREIAWHKSLSGILKPSYGSFKLTAVDSMNMISNMFLYYNDTGEPHDVMTFFVNNKGNYILNQNPTQKTDGLMSVATGLVYNQQGEIVNFVPSAQKMYEQQYKTLPPELAQTISEIQKQFTQTLPREIIFANSRVELVNTSNPTVFIYQGDSILNPGTQDFYVAASVNNEGIVTTYGLPLLGHKQFNNANALISLVSGTIYYLQSTPQKFVDALGTMTFDRLRLINSSSHYILGDMYSQYLSSFPTFTEARQSYKAYLQTLSAAEQLLPEISTAINTATIASQNAANSAANVSAYSSQSQQTTQNAANEANTAAQALKALYTQYQQAIKQGNAKTITTLTPQVKSQLTTTVNATSAANSAIAAAASVITQGQSSLNSFGNVSTTPPSNGALSSANTSQNFNTKLNNSQALPSTATEQSNSSSNNSSSASMSLGSL